MSKAKPPRTNGKGSGNGSTLPQLELPGLPALGSMSLPDLSSMDATGGVPDLDDILNPPVSIIEERVTFGEDAEENSVLVDEVVAEEFAAIHEGRKKQQEAIETANDTEYWFAVYFQTREQKEAFLKAVDWFEHGDKYIDGQFAAKKMGIEIPPRTVPFKVGKIDKKLAALT